jgi:hypothetical protein
LSPTNYFAFETMFLENNWTGIVDRWAIDQETATCLYSYAKQQSMY